MTTNDHRTPGPSEPPRPPTSAASSGPGAPGRFPAPDAPPLVVRTQADLERAWTRLMSPLGFSAAALWIGFVDAETDALLAQLVEVSDLPPTMDADDVESLASLLRHLDATALGGSHRFAFLVARPGPDAVTDRDRAHARGLLEACARAGTSHEVVHVATARRVRPVPLDDVAPVPDQPPHP
ncbi:hypothetical protein ACOACO_15825 [Nocardioides sp. CPCC 205120]|uniref:hypothetical protein n=1 Tax=Nocardioides sp. CPCC 205120 TaxID=3406462 RepID=UPI003B507757